MLEGGKCYWKKKIVVYLAWFHVQKSTHFQKPISWKKDKVLYLWTFSTTNFSKKNCCWKKLFLKKFSKNLLPHQQQIFIITAYCSRAKVCPGFTQWELWFSSSRESSRQLLLFNVTTDNVCVSLHQLAMAALHAGWDWHDVFLAGHMTAAGLHSTVYTVYSGMLRPREQALLFGNQTLGCQHCFLPKGWGGAAPPYWLAPGLWPWLGWSPDPGRWEVGGGKDVSSAGLACGQTERICFHTEHFWAWGGRLLFVMESQDSSTLIWFLLAC